MSEETIMASVVKHTADLMQENYKLKSDLKTAHEVIREFRAALEFYGDEENWQKPDQYVPYFTLWVDGDNVGYHRAKTILLKHAEFLKKIGLGHDKK